VGVFLSLIVPATALAQRRRAARPATKAQTATPTPQPAQTPAATTPATTAQPQATAPAPKPEAQPAATAQATGQAKGKYRLRLVEGPPRLFTLRSNQAFVSEIASALSRKLDVPVLLSPVMQKARVTLDFQNIPLEGALRLIAPQPFVDYEVSGDGGTGPKVVAVYLYGLNEPPPAESAVVRGDSEAILIEGDTEEGVKPESEREKQEKALNVKIERNQVTLHARRQPLTAVLYEIASKVDIPFEMKYDSSELVDVDLNNAPMEQVVRTLSPNVRLYQRTDLSTYETRPLRLVLAPPASAQQTNKM
jgi:hypothetical protein